MRTFFILLSKELRSFFFSPIAYIVLGLVMVLNGLAFNASIALLKPSAGGSVGSLVTWTFNSVWFYISYFAIFPLITMRLFAEEQRLGTIETLLTAPVRAWHLVAAKYVAAIVFYCLVWATTMANFAIFQWATAGAATIPTGSLIGSYTIVFAMGLFNVALGCLASALTSSQLIAAILTLTLTVIHFLLGFFATFTSRNMLPEASEELISYFSSVEHLETFTSGLIDSRPLVYYASLAILFLVFTHQALEFRRWKV